MEKIYWRLADHNAYIGFQCREYRKRHKYFFIRKWWFLLKSIIKNFFLYKYIGSYVTEDDVIRKIEECEIISFDVFDTLLLRPYEKPTDLFYDLEKRYNVQGFAKKRIIAEQMARKKYSDQEDVNLDQIYEMLEKPCRELKEREIEFEEEVLIPNKKIKRIYDEAIKRHKCVIIISDMYLSKKDIQKILEMNGYHGYEELYVSADEGVTKVSGNMYHHVMKSMCRKPEDYLHIGDNFYSDGNAYWKAGMKYLYTNCEWENYILFGN